MEAVIAIAIGVLFASGVWLILRPRTFQVIIGLLLVSYAVNLFIFIMGRLSSNQPPIVTQSGVDASQFALYLLWLLTSRGLSVTDHVDGKEARP